MVHGSAGVASSVGTLYVVGTPIGNLEDVTLRALRVLREVDLVAAEDTRTTRVLFARHDIHTPLTSFHEFTGPGKIERLVERLDNQDIALVSDAGTPAISDPGFPLIRAALAAGHAVVAVPGPSAVLSALVVSGLPTHAFTFVGFLPRKSGERQALFRRYQDLDHALVAFESPHRLGAALQDSASVLGDRPIAVCRELTKKFEEVLRGEAGNLREHFRQERPRGEFTLVIAGTGQRFGRE